MGQLRDRMYEGLKLRGYRPKTTVEHLRWGRLYAAYHRRSPQEMGEPEVLAFLMHLLEEKKVRPATHKMAGWRYGFLRGDTDAAGGGGADSVAQPSAIMGALFAYANLKRS